MIVDYDLRDGDLEEGDLKKTQWLSIDLLPEAKWRCHV